MDAASTNSKHIDFIHHKCYSDLIDLTKYQHVMTNMRKIMQEEKCCNVRKCAATIVWFIHTLSMLNGIDPHIRRGVRKKQLRDLVCPQWAHEQTKHYVVLTFNPATSSFVFFLKSLVTSSRSKRTGSLRRSRGIQQTAESFGPNR